MDMLNFFLGSTDQYSSLTVLMMLFIVSPFVFFVLRALGRMFAMKCTIGTMRGLFCAAMSLALSVLVGGVWLDNAIGSRELFVVCVITASANALALALVPVFRTSSPPARVRETESRSRLTVR